MKKMGHILQGWGKVMGLISVSPAESKLSEMRLKICGSCPHSKQSKFLKIVQGQEKYEQEIYCTKCGCPCLEKSLVTDEKCPVGKW